MEPAAMNDERESNSMFATAFRYVRQRVTLTGSFAVLLSVSLLSALPAQTAPTKQSEAPHKQSGAREGREGPGGHSPPRAPRFRAGTTAQQEAMRPSSVSRTAVLNALQAGRVRPVRE